MSTLSRVADCLHWLGRYIERAENTARFADVNAYLTLDIPDAGVAQWEPLVQATGDQALFHARHPTATRESVLHFLTFERENPNSIRSCVRQARENARAVRDQITLEMWEQVNACYELVEAAATAGHLGDLSHTFYLQVRNASHLLAGITQDTMSHNEAACFWTLGRMLERADKTARLLDVKYFILLPTAELVGTPLDDLQWAAVLRSASALEMYRKTHGLIRPDRIIAFLLLDREFPRSVLHCVEHARLALHGISGTPLGEFRLPVEQRLGQIHARLSYGRGADIVLGGLHEFLDDLQADLNGVGTALVDAYFSPQSTAAHASLTEQ